MNVRKNNNLSMQQLIDAKVQQHVQSFQTMLENDYTPEEAWEAIVNRSSFGPAIMEPLKAKCFALVKG